MLGVVLVCGCEWRDTLDVVGFVRLVEIMSGAWGFLVAGRGVLLLVVFH